MKFSDIIELAKAGYSPTDVKDLLSMTVDDSGTPLVTNASQPEKETPATEPGTPSGGNGGSSDINNEEKQDDHTDPKDPTDPTNPKDPKDQKIIDLEKKIAEMQKANAKKDLSDKEVKSDEDRLKDMISKFM